MEFVYHVVRRNRLVTIIINGGLLYTWIHLIQEVVWCTRFKRFILHVMLHTRILDSIIKDVLYEQYRLQPCDSERNV